MSEPRFSVGQRVIAVGADGRGHLAGVCLIYAWTETVVYPGDAPVTEWVYGIKLDEFPAHGIIPCGERALRPYDPPSSNTFTELMAKAKRGELEAA